MSDIFNVEWKRMWLKFGCGRSTLYQIVTLLRFCFFVFFAGVEQQNPCEPELFRQHKMPDLIEGSLLVHVVQTSPLLNLHLRRVKPVSLHADPRRRTQLNNHYI